MKFIVYGEPVAKGRPRFTRNGRAYTPQKTTSYENLVKLSYQMSEDTKFIDGEVKANIKAFFSIPKSTSKKKEKLMLSREIRPTKKPDLDNIAKSILDSLNGIAYKDDSYVVSLNIEKYYSHNPRVEVELKGSDEE
jgi:Holliday junction resolvase RusA-like endonuclease